MREQLVKFLPLVSGSLIFIATAVASAVNLSKYRIFQSRDGINLREKYTKANEQYFMKRSCTIKNVAFEKLNEELVLIRERSHNGHYRD